MTKNEEQQKSIPITKSDLSHHWQQRLTGTNLPETIVRYKDASYFENPDAGLDPETLIYELILKESTPEEGHLNWGHLTVYPGRVNDEYFCTRGHYHANPNTEEYFLCMKGEGLIMYLNREGDCWCEMLEEGSLHHVPGGVARKFINLSDEPLMLSLCRPANAGYDYDSIDRHPFPCHVYEDDGEMAIRVDVDENASDDTDDSSAIEALLRM